MRTLDRIARHAVFITFLVLLLAAKTHADDASVYESLSDVPIGRVFFSPKQRLSLDQHRKSPNVGQSARTGSRPRAVSKDAAGFIVSDSGKTRVYNNGDFVDSADTAEVIFPGVVRVARQPEVNKDSADESE